MKTIESSYCRTSFDPHKAIVASRQRYMIGFEIQPMIRRKLVVIVLLSGNGKFLIEGMDILKLSLGRN